ncbi:unnamed protein product [Caenorhabditis auriculariae]|uniref:histone deacetylase n=1 Tax=Caenorhabditis auriculariae TaxID=2777116 RepID=A0A8S1GWS1_9PELO|nr:unnamed protein product [Caenorhabditis auriculariae]
MDEAGSSGTGGGGGDVLPNDLLASAASNLDSERVNQLQTQLQEYRQKQMDLIGHFHRAQQELNMQHVQNIFAALQQQQQMNERAAVMAQNSNQEITEPVAPLTLASSLTSLLGSSSTPHTPTSSNPREHQQTSVPNNSRKCDILPRTNSTTISQLTKDRLKNMIANRSRGESSGSQSNLVGTPPSHAPISPYVNVSSPHFEPYRLPSSYTTANSSNQSSEFQLRKVNSEPNLKMRIRAKLLSKGSSPVQPPQQPNNTMFNFAHPQLRRSDSETSNMPIDTLLNAGGNNNPALPHLMLPSPSLPNLAAANIPSVQIPLDLPSIMAAANNLAPFLSLPTDPERQASRQPSQQGLLSQNVAVGGYPSLLKQQIRELVLRRKSLVKEEPEDAVDEGLYAGLLPASRLQELSAESMKMNSRESRVTGLAYDSAMARHECVCGDSASHVEHGGRVQSIWARLMERGLTIKCEKVVAKKATLEQLKLVHTPTYTTFFAVSPTACLKMEASALPVKSFVQLPCGGIGVDSDTYFNDASTQTAARIATGSLIELASQVAESRLKNGFACIRPPGHHAEKDTAMGFCFFNNVAITARYLQQKYPVQCARIAIVDWDVHHGNGTQLCFEEDPFVLYLSLHRHDNGNFFPGTGSVVEVGKGAGKGFTVNVPFSGDVMRDNDYLAAWRGIVLPVLEQYQPTFVLVSAGFDAAHGHPNALGGYEISPELFGYMTRSLMNFANGKVVLALEGGYDLASISRAAELCVQALCGEDLNITKLAPSALENPPCLSAQETIQKVIAIHKGYWPALTAHNGITTSSELQWQAVKHQLQSLSMASSN